MLSVLFFSRRAAKWKFQFREAKKEAHDERLASQEKQQACCCG
jgi:hypothetical protein